MGEQEEANRRVVLTYLEEVFNKGRIELVDDLVDRDFTRRWGLNDGETGSDQLKNYARTQREESPDWKIVVEETIAEGEFVTIRAHGEGHAWRPFLGVLPPPGKVVFPWIAIFRLRDSKIVEQWVAQDTHSVLSQHGITPDSIRQPDS